MKNSHWKDQQWASTFGERKIFFCAGENSNSHQWLCWGCKCVCQRPRRHPVPAAWLPVLVLAQICEAGESWVPAGESREESCVCLPGRWRHRAVQWERGESASRYCSSRQNRPYHCHHLWCCTTGIQTLSLCTAHCALLIPGTWYCWSTSSSGGQWNRAEFFLLNCFVRNL